jgi:D-methionine transport system ATP-binding protein
MIELQNVTKIFRQKHREIIALSGVSLTVPKGKIFGVIGASGAGKSTLIRCVNLLERPTSGEVIVDGQNLVGLRPAELSRARKEIGMIFQHFNLLSSRTVRENIAFPLELSHTPKAEIRRRVDELLTLVGITEKAEEYPANLSGGQKQRVAIARTLAGNPKVLLCDEATSALDPETTRSILELLKDINQKFHITILLITHEMNVIKMICDEVAVISEGKLIDQGKVSEVFSHPKTSLTQKFIASSFHISLPVAYQSRIGQRSDTNNQPILKLDFNGDSSTDPIFSEISRLFNVDSHLICGQMDDVDGVRFGVMLVELSGAAPNVEQTIAYYQHKQIKVEVLGYV